MKLKTEVKTIKTHEKDGEVNETNESQVFKANDIAISNVDKSLASGM